MRPACPLIHEHGRWKQRDQEQNTIGKDGYGSDVNEQRKRQAQDEENNEQRSARALPANGSTCR